MKRPFDLQDLGAAFSLANLWFITVWSQLLYPAFDGYFMAERHSEFAALCFNIALLAIVFWILIGVADRVFDGWLQNLFKIVFLVLALCAFGGLGSQIIKYCLPAAVSFVNIWLPMVVLTTCVMRARREKFALRLIVLNLKRLALLLLPFWILVYAQMFSHSLNTPNNFALSAKSALTAAQTPINDFQKVVWVIFDELDGAALTTAREKNVELVNFERLINESFTAVNAVSPNPNTKESIPALLTGTPLLRAEPVAPNDLELFPADDSPIATLRESRHIFFELSDINAKIGIVGWAHPYARIFDREMSAGAWRPLTFSRCEKLMPCAVDVFRLSLLDVPGAARLFPALSENVAEQRDRHEFLVAQAQSLLIDNRLDVMFFHFSVPHHPYLNRNGAQTENDYFDALAVADQTLGALRKTLEDSNELEKTVLIVSSDHALRDKTPQSFDYLPPERRQAAALDVRIPFLVRFPEQQTRVDYDLPFNTIATKELVLALVRKEIKNPAELTAQLKRCGSRNNN